MGALEFTPKFSGSSAVSMTGRVNPKFGLGGPLPCRFVRLTFTTNRDLARSCFAWRRSLARFAFSSARRFSLSSRSLSRSSQASLRALSLSRRTWVRAWARSVFGGGHLGSCRCPASGCRSPVGSWSSIGTGGPASWRGGGDRSCRVTDDPLGPRRWGPGSPLSAGRCWGFSGSSGATVC